MTGLSSGAGMSVALAVAQRAYFAAAGSVQGLPSPKPRLRLGSSASIPVFQACLRRCGRDANGAEATRGSASSPHHGNPLAQRLRRQHIGIGVPANSWIRRYGLSPNAVATLDCTAEGVACTQSRYGTAQRSVVETVFYDGKRGDFIATNSHYWVGDNSGQFANPTGPSASELQWSFFKAHPFRESQPPSVSIKSAALNGNSGPKWNGVCPTGSIASVTVRLDGRFPQPSKTASGTNHWAVTFDNLPSDAFYVPVATAKDNDGATTSASGNPVPVIQPPPNAPPSVAINSASVAGDCVTVTGSASDPEGQLMSIRSRATAARGRKRRKL